MTRVGGRLGTAAAWGICLGLLAAFVGAHAVAADGASIAAPKARSPKTAIVAPAKSSPESSRFGRERASPDTRQVAEWVIEVGDNKDGDGRPLPFALLDKKDAKVFVFDAEGQLRGAAPALIGLGRGDDALPDIGTRELSAIAPKDRVTQAGRFVADLGVDSHGDDVLWLDYAGGLAMHRVITTNPKERRAHRLTTATPLDNRISFGCINLPVKFYEKVVQPAFSGTRGIVYVLPEYRHARQYFASGDSHDGRARANSTNSPTVGGSN